MELVRRANNIWQRNFDTLPLFPNSSGEFVNKKAMVETFCEAARRLHLPLQTHSGATAFSGHSLRMGGIQFLGAQGVELWRIQALARHSSSATLRYLGNSHVNARPDVSSDAATRASIESMRDSLKNLSAEVQALKLKAPPGSTAATVVTHLAEVCPPAAAFPAGSKFVACKRRNAKLHIIDRSSEGWSLCDWAFTCSTSINFYESELSAPGHLKLCPECVKRQALPSANDIHSDPDSESRGEHSS